MLILAPHPPRPIAYWVWGSISRSHRGLFKENFTKILIDTPNPCDTLPAMDQDRIDYIVEELEQYLPTSAQALLQELMEGLRQTPAVPENDLKENFLNDMLRYKYPPAYPAKYTPTMNEKYNRIMKPLSHFLNSENKPQKNHKETRKEPEKNYWETA